jgi:hypothetical protein
VGDVGWSGHMGPRAITLCEAIRKGGGGCLADIPVTPLLVPLHWWAIYQSGSRPANPLSVGGHFAILTTRGKRKQGRHPPDGPLLEIARGWCSVQMSAAAMGPAGSYLSYFWMVCGAKDPRRCSIEDLLMVRWIPPGWRVQLLAFTYRAWVCTWRRCLPRAYHTAN